MTEPLWTSAEIASATGGTARGTWDACGVSIDSRTIRPGEMFLAIRGDYQDGHNHIAGALAAGAAGLLVETLPPDLPADAPLVEVKDTTLALTRLAAAARARATGTLIAVTGSVGKTTTKEMLQHIAAAQGPTHATLGNLNNHIGLPLTLTRLPAAVRTGIFEIGMNHAGEIAPLARLLHPHIALITTIGTAHIENFSDGQLGIAHAKAEIFAGFDGTGTAILPRDSEFFPLLKEEARQQGATTLLSFGSHERADARLLACTLHPEHTEVTASICGHALTYLLPAAGEHMAMNSLAALLAATQAGLDPHMGAQALHGFSPLKGRGARRHFGDITVIDESYNANPQSMIAAIRVLGQSNGRGRRLVALGDMLELGDTAPDAHRSLAAALDEAQVDLVFCCGPLMQALWQAVTPERRGAWTPDARTLAPLVADAVRGNDILLVKGSHGEPVKIGGVSAPSMAQVIAAIETAWRNRENGSHAA